MKNLGLIRIRCLELLSQQYPSIGVMIARVDGVTTRLAHWAQESQSRIYSKELSRDELVFLINRADFVVLRPKEIHNRESTNDHRTRTKEK